MSAVEHIPDAEVMPDEDRPKALVRQSVPTLAVTPTVTASELVARLDVIRDAARDAMTEGVDYGKVPGTDKPTLFKPGAEKLSVLFQLDVQLVNEKVWGPGDHLTVLSHATVYHAPTGQRLGFGEGLATTRERKHAYRKQERVCPDCGKPAIIRGKQEFGGGWLCWKKKDGCGTTFAIDNPAIADQAVGDIENPDLPDLWNPVVKMAQKRARVDAVLAVTGASALFTQDMEDPNHEAPAPELPFGPRLEPELKKVVGAACTQIAGGEPSLGRALFESVANDCGGYMPQAAALALIHAAEGGNRTPHVEAPEVT